MSPGRFSTRLTRAPLPFDPRAAAQVELGGFDPAAHDLIRGAAGCSPYLRDLLQTEAPWLRAALSDAPETAMDGLLAGLPDLAPDALAPGLRQAKRRAAALVALADLGGVWGLEQVTGALTALADAAVQAGLTALVADEVRRGKLPDTGPPDQAGGMVVLAMGKMGAGELNYSSDIDLICLFDETRYPGAEQEARAACIRVTRRLAALLSDTTTGGYVFRTDLRLRPDAAVTPVCLSMAAAYAYYEAEGRTWERAAYIKARPCAGDLAAGQRFLTSLKPFVWRRHLDFAAIEEAHDMRLRIRDHRGLHGPIAVEGHNLKLGAGGIREIEFFAQTRQLIAGGRDETLRDRGTLPALAALAARGWIPGAVADELADLYRAHRLVEHRLQMVADAQTHQLPGSAEGVARIAAFCGETEAAFRAGLLDRLHRTDALTEGFFAPSLPVEAAPDLSDQATQIVQAWDAYPCLRSDRAQGIFRRLKPRLLAALSRAAHPDEALVAFDGFLSGLPAGVQLFSLFEQNQALVDLIVDICGTAPRLARHLARNAAVFDAVIGGSFWTPWPGVAGLVQGLSARMAGDYETRLDAARHWAREWHFRIGVHHLRGLIGAEEAGKAYADLAEAVILGLWPVVTDAFAARHGPQPGAGAVLLGMGSLGAGRLNAQSDLDLILIYDAAGAETSDGPRPLPVRTYYARLTQAMVTALSAQTAAGRIYEVDVRLRPSGRAGAVATSLASFKAYQRDEAWTWEHLALTRARVMAGAPALAAAVEAERRAVLAEVGQRPGVAADVAEMRARLFAAKPAQGAWEAKNGPGRIMDIELLAEMAALRAASPLRGVEAQLRGLGEPDLIAAMRLLWRLHAACRLLSDTAVDPDALGIGGTAFVLRETGEATVASLTARVASVCALADEVITRHLAAEQ